MPNSDSRARFVAKLCLVLLPFVLFGGWLELRLCDLPTSYSQKRMGFQKVAPRLRTLVLGASEGLQGVDASQLGQDAYNLANVGQSLYYDRNLLAWALPQAPKLRRVLLCVSYQSLAYRLVGTAESWRAVAYFREFGVLPEEGLSGLDFRFASAALFYEPYTALHWALTGQGLSTPVLTPRGQDVLPCFSGDEVDVKVNIRTAAQRAATHEALIHLDSVDANLGELQIVSNLTKARGVTVSLFCPPVTLVYAQAINTARRTAMLARLKDFAAQQGLDLKDYFQDPRFDDNDFFDVDHLCSEGSEKFSGILAHDFGLVGPGLVR